MSRDLVIPETILWTAQRGEPWLQVLAAVDLLWPELLSERERLLCAEIVSREPGDGTNVEFSILAALARRTARFQNWGACWR